MTKPLLHVPVIEFDVPEAVFQQVNNLLAARRNANGAITKAKVYKANFIEAGLCHYEDMDNSGNLLLQKATLDKMLNSFIGCPVVDMRHETPATLKDGYGVVSDVWYDPNDGQYWCTYIVWDPHLQALCDLGAENGQFSVSCAYDPTEGTEGGGEWHSIPYEGEVLDGVFTHLAIVPNPRYEGAKIHRCNSKVGGILMFGKKEIKAEDVFKIGDQEVTGKDILERLNAKPEVAEPTDATEIDLGEGRKAKLGDLKASHIERLNAAADDEEKRKEEERKNAEDEEKRKKEEDEEKERKNAEEKERKEKDDKEKEEERKNSSKHFQELQRVRMNKEGVETVIESKSEAVERGRTMFGSKGKKA